MVLGYCRDNLSIDVLIPNRDDGDIFWRRKDRSAYRASSRAGAPPAQHPRNVLRC